MLIIVRFNYYNYKGSSTITFVNEHSSSRLDVNAEHRDRNLQTRHSDGEGFVATEFDI